MHVVGGGAVSSATVVSTTFQDVSFEVNFGSSSWGLQPQLFTEGHPIMGSAAAVLALPAMVSPAATKDFEMILLLDRSSSMTGARLSRMRQATHTFLRSLPVPTTLTLMLKE